MVQSLTFEILKKEEIKQVVILGAGLSPFSLEILNLFPDVNIFELDLEFMDEKSSLLKDLFHKKTQNIHCIPCDIEFPEFLFQSLKKKGWRAEEPTLIIVEGISYYVKKENLFKNLCLFSKNSFVIFEYMVPYGEISQDRRHITERIFKQLSKECHLSFIKQYSLSEIKEQISQMKAHFHHNYTMKDCEIRRTLENKVFPEDNSSWIQICTFSL